MQLLHRQDVNRGK